MRTILCCSNISSNISGHVGPAEVDPICTLKAAYIGVPVSGPYNTDQYRY